MLTVETQRRIDALFPPQEREEASELLDRDCGTNLPFCENSSPESLERIRFAALKISRGKLERLLDAVLLAQTDWRDLLMAAGFGEDISAHERWFPGAADRET